MTYEHPHLTMKPVGPKGPGRLWTCAYEGCTEPGRYNEVAKRDCIEPTPPPCEWCGKTPECDLNCMGIKVLFADPDVRMIVGNEVLDDDLFKRSRLNMLVSMWGQQVTGLPIDFQIQTQVEAQSFAGRRCALGVGAAVKGET